MVPCPNQRVITRDRTLAVLLTATVVMSALTIGLIGSVGTVAAAGTADVALTPTNQTIDAGTTTTYDLVVDPASNGVGAYEFTITSNAESVVEIEGVDLHGNPGAKDVNISSDGSRATVSAALADTAQTGSVVIATVTVSGEGAGEAHLSLSNVDISDEAGEAYTLGAVSGSSIQVQESVNFNQVELSETTVDEESTVTQTIEFELKKLSNDGNSDVFELIFPSDAMLASPSVTVTSADGSDIAVSSGPTLSDANGGTNNALTFGVQPDSDTNTSLVTGNITVDVSTGSVPANVTRSMSLYLTDSSGETAETSAEYTVRDTNTSSGSSDGLEVVIQTPEEANAGTSVEAQIVVTGVSGTGIGSYVFAASVTDPSIANITGVDLGGDPGLDDVNLSTDGSSLTVDASLADTADSGNVTIATLTLATINTGNVSLDTNVSALYAEDGSPLSVDGQAGTELTVIDPAPTIVGDKRATDPDDDGLYEDINGDGVTDVGDVQALFSSLSKASNYPDYFDFNGDNVVDVGDVQALFRMSS